MKGLLVYFLILSIFLLSVPAFAFELTPDEVKAAVPTNSVKTIDLNLYSKDADKFTLSIDSWKPWVNIDPPQPDVSANETRKISITFSPFVKTPLGLYQITVLVTSSGKEQKKTNFFVSVVQGEGAKIEKILTTGNFQPQGSVIIRTYVMNIGESRLENVILNGTIVSPSGTIKRIERVFPVNPEETKVIENLLPLRSGAPGGEYKIFIKLFHDGKEIDSNEQTFLVQEKSIIEKTIQRNFMLTGFRKTITVRNNGNVFADEHIIYDTVSGIDRIFYSGDEPDGNIDGVVSWKIINLEPGEVFIISYKVDYLPLYILLIAILAGLWFFFSKFRTLRVVKYILQKKNIKEGEEFTVAIEVKNATGSRVTDVEIVDFVPNIFKLKITKGPKPARRKSEIGTELIWSIDQLNYGEERVLTYKITPTFGVSDRIKLPTTILRYRHGGKLRENETMPCMIGVSKVPEKKTLNLRRRINHKKAIRKFKSLKGSLRRRK